MFVISRRARVDHVVGFELSDDRLVVVEVVDVGLLEIVVGHLAGNGVQFLDDLFKLLL